MRFLIYAIDKDDGDSTEIVDLYVKYWENVRAGQVSYYLQVCGDVVANVVWGFEHQIPRASFSISMRNDRSEVGVKSRIWPNGTDEDVYLDYHANGTVADVAPDAGYEFLLRTLYTLEYTGDVGDPGATVSVGFEDFAFIERDIFTDVVNAIIEPLGNFFQVIFVGLFRFIADIFRSVGDGLGVFIQGVTTAVTALQTALTTAINNIQGWLTTLGTTITTAIGQIETWLTTIATTISNAIGDIEGWLNSIATTITEGIAEIAADIWAAFGTAASDIMDDIITALTNLAADVADFIDGVIQSLIPLLQALAADLAQLFFDIAEELVSLGGDILNGIITFIAGAVFFVWEALGLPDILAILEWGLVGLGQFITNLPQFLSDWFSFFVGISSLFSVFGFIWIFLLPVAIADTVGGFLEKMIEHMFVDLSGGLSLLGFRIPIPFVIPWGLLTVFTFLSDTFYMGFF